ncbi:MAG: helix-turn-helix domain-containing protein [Actinocatenispora sp.]
MTVPAGQRSEARDGERVVEPGPRPEERLLALWESVSRSRGWRRPALTELDGVLFAVVTDAGGSGEAGCWAWLQRVSAEVARTEPGVRVAAGGVGPLDELATSAGQARSLLRLLTRGIVAGPIAHHEASWAAAVLDQVTGALPLAELTGVGPLRDLLAHDGSRGGWYAETLRAELEHPGDPAAASRQLHVHPNTFRYRMRRLRSALPADLESPEVRLALQIQLSALRLQG